MLTFNPGSEITLSLNDTQYESCKINQELLAFLDQEHRSSKVA